MDLEELEKDPRPFIQEWIEQQSIDWNRPSPHYWRNIFRRAAEESKMPPTESQTRPVFMMGDMRPRGPRPSEDTIRQRWVNVLGRISTRLEMVGRTLPESMTWSDNEPRDHAEWIRRIRYIERALGAGKLPRTFTSPVVEYGPAIGNRLDREIDRLRKEVDDPCIDNIRWADKSSRSDRKRYYYAKNTGCCGSTDEEVTILGKKFLIGLNFGH